LFTSSTEAALTTASTKNPADKSRICPNARLRRTLGVTAYSYR
jgi:hypothetical protein